MAVITLSRQMGSGGDLVAARAAEILGYDLVDKALITEVAREAKVPESEVVRFDERTENAVKRFMRGLITPSRSVPIPPAMLWGLEFPYEVSAALINSENLVSEEAHFLDQKSYLKFLQNAFERLWERDRVVLCGRGGMMILKDRARTLSIRTVAPLEFRIRHVMERWSLSRDSAIDRIQKGTRRRAAYIRVNYGADWEEPALYHLVLNTDRLGFEGAAQVIADAALQADRQQPT
jgi:cytidylate kinase